MHLSSVQRYGFLLLPGFALPSLAGATDALAEANRWLGERHYEPCLLSADGAPVHARCGSAVAVRQLLTEAALLDAAFVVAAEPPGAAPSAAQGAAYGWLKAHAEAGALIGGMDAGACWLAAAGVLQGWRAAVHWPHVPWLTEQHAQTIVTPNLYTIDRGRLSCAGGQASLDLMLAWLGQRHGERLAHALAAEFGLERVRGADERQRLPSSVRAGAASAKLAEAVSLMEANLGEPLPTEEIARLVGVSRRQLERLFKQHLDDLPARFYLGLRLQRAQRLLCQSGQSVLQIALASGFASGPHFSTAYRQHFGHTPREARARQAAAWRQGAADNPAPWRALSIEH